MFQIALVEAFVFESKPKASNEAKFKKRCSFGVSQLGKLMCSQEKLKIFQLENTMCSSSGKSELEKMMCSFASKGGSQNKDLGVLYPCMAQLENIDLFFKSGYNKKNECLARKPYSVLLKICFREFPCSQKNDMCSFK